LILIASVWFATVLNLALWRFVIDKIEVEAGITNFLFMLSLPLVVMAPLYILFSIIVVPYLAKPLLALLLITSAATNYFMFELGVYIDVDMLRNTFETNTREALDLLTWSKVLWVAGLGVIPAALIAATKIEYGIFRVELAKRAGSVLLLLAVISGLLVATFGHYAPFVRNNRQARKIINTQNYIYAATKYFLDNKKAKREFVNISYDAKHVPFRDPHRTVLVLVLGETARAANFQLLGYGRETNPLLSKQDVIAFRDVNACGTSTAVSVPCIFAHTGRSDFSVVAARHTGNLLDIAQAAGYRVIWLDNDDGCKGVCARADVVKRMVEINDPKHCDGKFCRDEALLEHIPGLLKNIEQDTLIVLHTMGSHGPTYYKRYPDSFRKFAPTCDTASIQKCSRAELLNTYDNTILYTDFIISSVIDMLKKHPEYEAGMIYISDHGESLGENNVYLHGLPYTIAPKEQTHVPKIIYMNDTMKRWDYIDWECLRRDAATKSYTHDNLFHSVLGLLEIKSKKYKPALDIFKPCRTKELFSE